MSWLEAIVLGIVQGLTEFLPISSSAHLSIVGQLFFEGKDPGAAFTAITQLGTETAVILYFARDIGRIIKAWWLSIVGIFTGKTSRPLDPDARMGWLVILGSIPIIILGLLFEDAIDTYLRNLWITVGMLAGFAVLIWLCDRFAQNYTELEKLTWADGIAFGFAQAMALIPGVSRSGATIAAGLFMGYKREAATRYSFLLAIPAVFGSGLYKLFKAFTSDSPVSWGPTLVATLIAFAVGLGVIHWVLKYISTHSFNIFVCYRLAIAALTAALIIFGVLQA
ncbi:MAG: undecaprenyl-diphosphate phosphatase [Propionibacteriaceae bacterium]|jgi:undecaprenyl-diphosphatase|nr:undecaprenyl-diphosphate phosphatase [Propionibacteriaceae bacterium]